MRSNTRSQKQAVDSGEDKLRVLFLGIDLEGLHGSFLHIFEYAQYFRKRGDEVYVASVFISQANRDLLESEGIIVKSVGRLPLDVTYNLVYALHLILFPALLCQGLKYDRAILMSLSGHVPIELLPPSVLWPQYDLLGVLSEEIRQMYKKKYNISPERLTIIPNHVPLNFIDRAFVRESWSKSLNKVCIVSNHYNPELASLKDMAPFSVDYFGSQYNNQVRITPELLLEYDAVITIGKTVQYCLALGIPVFEYDLFGGCGYITPDNILKEEMTNFSGRGTQRKLHSQTILLELANQYPQACLHAPELRLLALERYSLNKLVEKQIQAVGEKRQPRPKLNVDARLFCNAAFAALSYVYRGLDTPQESLAPPDAN